MHRLSLKCFRGAIRGRYARAPHPLQRVAGGKRSFNTASSLVSAVASSPSPQYRLVPFEKEEFDDISVEVPDIRYYHFGSKDAKDNIHKNTNMTTPLRSTNSEGQVVGAADAETVPDKHVEAKVEYSKLENGLRIVSLDKGSMTSSIALYVDAGSRYEPPEFTGLTHFLEIMAFHSTAHLSWLRTVKTLEAMGAIGAASAGRDCMSYYIECLRTYVPISVPLLIGNVLFPRLLPWEVNDRIPKIEAARNALSEEGHLTEMLHATAWHRNTLGNNIIANEKVASQMNSDVLREYMMMNFSPDRMVLAGVNVAHSELTKWGMRSFAEYNAISPTTRDASANTPVYTGGMSSVERNLPRVTLAIAFETDQGWSSPDLVPLSVLVNVMGGGGSFSTGGPGKGMHSKLYLEVLNRVDYVEGCYSLVTSYAETGLFGMYAVGDPYKGREIAELVVSQLKKMHKVTPEALKRGKNALKSLLHMSYENRRILLDDIGRQLIMTDKYISAQEFCAEVDKVTDADIKRVAEKLLSKKPTVVAYGDCLTVPHYEEICALLKK